ncbi:hypothetical protein LZC95_32515 [Pendulispora brunnea]|uniref:Polymerase nucleotidyl transferase domain-containing protein n=1 Tax=Pendulispora brunnea TaxID=2905690 RepID=A0ABZ2JXT8_9BACT
MPNLSDLVLLAREHIPPRLLAEVVVMGSAAIALHGVDLGRAPGDIDLFVSVSTLDAWPSEGFTRGTKHGIPRITADATDLLEIFATFPGVAFDAVNSRAGATPISHGLRVAALDDLLTWKRAQARLRADAAGRTKDENDIRAMEAYQGGVSFPRRS